MVYSVNLSICAISDEKEIAKIESDLDEFVKNNSENPFALSAFVRARMKSTLPEKSFPEVLVLTASGKILGVAPLLIRKRMGVRFATLLFDFWFSPDFIFEPQYRQVCTKSVLDYIFNNLGCQYANLDLPAESPNIQNLKQICDCASIFIHEKNDPAMGHCVIPVQCKWSDFQKLRGVNFRHHFKGIERKLNSAGSWKIEELQDKQNEKEVIQRIVEIEKTSWKEAWRRDQQVFNDEQLLQLWEVSSSAIGKFPGFSRTVCFLELNGQPIAYSFSIQYKGVAYIAKTSYNNKYRKLYPSIYAINKTLSCLFDCSNITLIDFMTNLPFMKRWTPKQMSRVRLSLRKGLLPNLVFFAFQQPQIGKIMHYILKKFSL
jgi:hypothetical protein